MTSDAPRPDLVIFDCDGVLVDSELLSCQCLSQVLEQCGIAVTAQEALELFLGRSLATILQHYRDHNLDQKAFLAALKTTLSQSFTSSLKAIPGVSAVVASLTTPFCVASSS